MRTPPTVFIVLTALALLVGCSTYRDEFRYAPRPAGLVIANPPPASPAQPLEMQASIIGVRTGHPKEHPDTIEVRVRIENRTPAPAVFVAESLQLVASDLSVFDHPNVEPAEGLRIEPGAVGMVAAYFPLTRQESHPRQAPLAGLNLRWVMKVGDQAITCSTNFARRPYDDGPHGYPYYYDSWWSPRFGVGMHFRR